MGCGKSKHDVASDNTLLRKKSSVNAKENEAQTVDKSNNINVNNVSLETEQKNNENAKEVAVGAKGNESNDVEGKAPEITNVKEDKALEKNQEVAAEDNKTPEIVVAEEPNQESERGKDESLEKNEQVMEVAEEKPEEKKDESQKEDVSSREETLVKEEESKDTREEELAKEEETNQENTLAKEEETKETNQEKTLAKEGETQDANVSTSTSS